MKPATERSLLGWREQRAFRRQPTDHSGNPHFFFARQRSLLCGSFPWSRERALASWQGSRVWAQIKIPVKLFTDPRSARGDAASVTLLLRLEVQDGISTCRRVRLSFLGLHDSGRWPCCVESAAYGSWPASVCCPPGRAPQLLQARRRAGLRACTASPCVVRRFDVLTGASTQLGIATLLLCLRRLARRNLGRQLPTSDVDCAGSERGRFSFALSCLVATGRRPRFGQG